MHAVLADIHGNLEALTAVLADIDSRGINRIICLGDTIGFGPDPAACLDIAMGFDMVLRGCSDRRVFDDWSDYNPTALAGAERDLAELKADGLGNKRLQFLRVLPLTAEYDGVLFTHAFPADGTWPWYYLPNTEPRTDPDEIRRYEEQARPAIEAAKGPVLVGHTHQPSAIRSDGTHRYAKDLGSTCEIETGVPCVIDVGAVGWPKDGDPRASYVTVDKGVVSWHRVEYDHALTTEKLLKLAMPPSMAEFRLGKGW